MGKHSKKEQGRGGGLVCVRGVDAVGCMEEGLGVHLGPRSCTCQSQVRVTPLRSSNSHCGAPALALSLSAAAVLRQHLLSFACHSRNACVRRRSIIKLQSLTSWQLKQQWDGSLMDRRLPGQQRAASRSGYGTSEVALTSHQAPMLLIIAHFIWTGWWW